MEICNYSQYVDSNVKYSFFIKKLTFLNVLKHQYPLDINQSNNTNCKICQSAKPKIYCTFDRYYYCLECHTKCHELKKQLSFKTAYCAPMYCNLQTRKIEQFDYFFLQDIKTKSKRKTNKKIKQKRKKKKVNSELRTKLGKLLGNEKRITYICLYNPTVKILQFITDCGIDILSKGDLSTTFFHHYLHHNESYDQDVINFLFEKGADPNMFDNYQRTLFFHILGKEKLQIELVNFFFERGADLNMDFINNITIFHYFCQNRGSNAEILLLLLKKGANPNEANYHQITPFHEACLNKYLKYDFLNALLQVGNANPNSKNKDHNTPFHYYIFSKNDLQLKYIKLFLLYGADQNLQNTFGRSPFLSLINKLCFLINK
ncbi:ankyrin repeat-containing protein [Anaeramoeba flamelloides]|uniref:Ankyrin repeat-containing protein n=1 Tax=Anaeramoeba flamelloides TaxID=1746091 RepID=A0AAV7Z7T2_9EUKA|nr:ankyrin repeat-containing protein [Anaeramoeba flamelloides]